MPQVKLSPIYNDEQLDNNGLPASGYLLETCSAGSTTDTPVYTDNTGNAAHTNPIALNSRGEPPAPIWIPVGSAIKFILKTPGGAVIRTVDNVTGVNDSSISQSQWQPGPTGTYVSANSFTLAGDQRTIWEVDRRVRVTDAGGQHTGTITASAYDGSALTTITVLVDGGATFTTPIATVEYSLLSASNISLPHFVQAGTNITVTYDTQGRPKINSTLISAAAAQCRLTKSGANLLLSPFGGNLLQNNGVLCTIPDAGVTLAPTSLVPLISITNRAIAANVATLTHGALAAAIPVGSLIAVRDVGGASAYNGLKIVTASTTTTTSYAAVAANEGITADTNGRVLPIYYIYAVATAGVITSLEASNTLYAVSTTAGNKGMPIKTGDDTRTLVGMAALVAGPAWQDAGNQRFVVSYWNRLPVYGAGTYTASRSTGSGSYVELNTEIRVEFLTWGPVQAACNGVAVITAGGQDFGIAFDGITPNAPSSAGSATIAASNIDELVLAEGYHYVTYVARSSSGTITTGSGGAASAFTTIRTRTEG
jgi:hypothetical protein